MREIKFRAWDNERKQIINYISSISPITHNLLNISINNHMLMQYTGLKDKNGKEIYEGDIIKITKWKWEFRRWGKEYVTDIYFEHWAFRYRWGDWSGSILDFRSVVVLQWYELITQDVEIIWNIYKNPELLNKE